MKRLLALSILLSSAIAHAQATDVEVPVLILDTGDPSTPAQDEALDVANIVVSAAKGVTTVQEAPAIVTVVTADEIRDRQFMSLPDLFDTVPGWSSVGLFHGTFVNPIVRGQGQAVQFLHDGMSLFDPFVNVPAATRVQPMELIKRVEMITGPGGVLWGSNSLLGILNVITKDAEDIEGIETGGQLGDGRGDRLAARAYVMAGKSGLLDGKLSLFAHASVESYQGPQQQFPLLIFHNALPQPNSANVYGPLTETDQERSLITNFFVKAKLGKLQLRVSAPFGSMYNPAGLSGNPSRTSIPDDDRCIAGVLDATCADPLRTSRENQQNVYDRYAVAEYQTRFADEKAGITARAYGIQFVRGFTPLQVLAPSTLVQGGLAFQADLTSYRYGTAIDGDLELTRQLRVQYGVEAFYETKPDTVKRSRQGAGTESEIVAPYDLERLPLLCPRIFDGAAIVPIAGCPLTFAFDADRTVLGAYVNPQYRPNKKLIFDLGGRVQVAPPSLGLVNYDLSTTVAGSFVWNFVPGWHVKLNYAQGFRPPVFNNTTSNGEGVQIGGNPNLGVERSDAGQVELNARIWKGERRIRELSFRVDASYTRIDNLIQVTSGNYDNSGQRGIASAEFLGKLFVQGGHRIELGYTYLRVDTSDKGRLRNLPEHWFDLATVFSLIPTKLTATARMKITGAAEDPNRLVEYRGLTYDAMGEPQSVSVAATDLVLDRLPPQADLSLGVSYMPNKHLTLRATVYNALLQHAYQPDVFGDYEPHLEYLPNPTPGFRAYLSALVSY
jgi:outer membrane receptor protein involved in Fe transport